MADQVALTLYQLIGAPLHALIDAERLAAQATRDFIAEVGFIREMTDPDDFGQLRMVTFRHRQQGTPGEPDREVTIQVPLLSLLPIPALQIKDAELEYYARIVETVRRETTAAPRPVLRLPEGSLPALETDAALPGRLARVDLNATIGRSPVAATNNRSLDMQMRIKVRMEQADLPAGLGRLFHLMEHIISRREEPAGSPPQK